MYEREREREKERKREREREREKERGRKREREGEREKERERECVQHVYLLHFSPKPLLTEIQHHNIINIIIGICFPFNYIISTVKS